VSDDICRGFDWAALNQMEADFGGDIFRRLLEACISDTTERIEKLSQAVDGNDLPAIRTIAHQLRGILAQFSENVASETAKRACEVSEAELPSVALELVVQAGRSVELLRQKYSSNSN
jgi:HPt (histidine-containing phosphotransfer) domain-containing protein